uniref:Uncharacterized protein n=1 Tax=Trichuris muris TaxID=70415 RepID=A0A5S6R2R8_TRIMR
MSRHSRHSLKTVVKPKLPAKNQGTLHFKVRSCRTSHLRNGRTLHLVAEYLKVNFMVLFAVLSTFESLQASQI